MSLSDSTVIFHRVSVALLTRLGVYSLLLAVFLLAQVLQPFIYNTSVSLPLFSVLAIAFFAHAIAIDLEDLAQKTYLKSLLILDIVLVSVLFLYTDISNSLFLFLYFVLILLAGFVYSYLGAFYIALASGISFTFSTLLDPNLESMPLLFLVLMNNGSFLVAAFLSGYLSSQLETTGEALVRTDTRLRNIENFNDLIMAQIPAGIAVFNERHEVVRVNSFAERSFEDAGDIEGQYIQGLFSGFSGTDQFKDLTELNNKSFELYEKTTNIDEQRVYLCELRAMKDIEVGEKLFILLFQDVTHTKRLEARLRQKEKLAAIGQLAAGIAHEIRNPLASISGSVEMMTSSLVSEDDKKLMGIVLKETDRLNNLITEFLDYARPDAPISDSVNVNRVVQDVIQQCQMDQSLDKSVQLELSLESTTLIRGSRDKLKQAFLNLIVNAYQALNGSSQPRIAIRTWDDSGEVIVSIEDNGQGMTKETLSRLFEPFHTTKPKGTGLGLAVTHKILETHRAEIKVESEKGKGSLFRIQFPGE